MCNALGIGFGLKNVTGVLEVLADLLIIFNDAVMHYTDIFRNMRMSVIFGGNSVSRPTRMSNPDLRSQILFLTLFFQLGNASDGANTRKIIVSDNSDSGGIITAIL